MEPEMNTHDSLHTESKKWWQRLSTLYIAGGVIMAIVITAGLIISLSGKSGKNDPQASDKLAVYYDRPGYNRAKLSSGIGDPAALVLKKSPKPISYLGAVMVQACSVFSPDAVKKLGLNVRPHSLTVAFQRTYFDGQGQGTLRGSSFAPSLEDANSCMYTVADQNDNPYTLWMEVFQPPYVSRDAIDYELSRKYQEISQINGFKVYQYRDDSEAGSTITTMLRSNDNAVRITTSITDASKLQILLQTAADNFSSLLASPDGPATIAYQSPLMTVSTATACSLLQPNDVKTTFNDEASPLVTEGATTAVGVIRFGAKGSPQYNYVITDCTRGAVVSEADAFSFRNRSLTLEATTYRETAGAEADVASHKAHGKHIKPVTTKLGDEAFFSNDGFKQELTVRKGRFVLAFSNSDKQGTDDQLIAVAKQVVPRASNK